MYRQDEREFSVVQLEFAKDASELEDGLGQLVSVQSVHPLARDLQTAGRQHVALAVVVIESVVFDLNRERENSAKTPVTNYRARTRNQSNDR